MKAQRLQPGLDARLRAFERMTYGHAYAFDRMTPRFALVDVRCAGGFLPDLEVGRAVADVFKALRSFLLKQARLGGSLVVDLTVASDRAIKQAEALRDLVDNLLVGG